MGIGKAKFGKDFQRHLLAILVQKPEAASLLHQFLEPMYFEGKRTRKAFRFVQKVWRKKKQCPSEALFVEAVADRQMSQDIYYADVGDWKATIDYASDFAQTQAIKVVIDDWAGKINTADKEILATMVADVKNAVAVGQATHENPGEFFQADLEDHIQEYLTPPESMEPLGTGISHLDIAMRGGAMRGELNVVAGRAKVGKSTFLLNLAYGALTPMMNAKVAFFSLEMKRQQCRQRLHKRIALKNDEYIENAPNDFVRLLRQRRQMLTGDMYLKAYPQRTMTASMMEADLDRLAGSGFIPDMIIVDYGNIMKSESRSKETRERIAHNFTELRRIGQERDVYMWSGAQGNRGSVKKIVFGMDDIGDTFEIPQVVDSLWTINRTSKEELKGTARLVSTAARRFQTGISIDCAVNLDIGIFRSTGFTKRTKVKDDEDEDDALAGYRKNKSKRKAA